MLLLLTFGFEFDYESAFFFFFFCATCCVWKWPERREEKLHTAVWCQLWWGVCAMCVVWEEKLTLFAHNSHNHMLRAAPHLHLDARPHV